MSKKVTKVKSFINLSKEDDKLLPNQTKSKLTIKYAKSISNMNYIVPTEESKIEQIIEEKEEEIPKKKKELKIKSNQPQNKFTNNMYDLENNTWYLMDISYENDGIIKILNMEGVELIPKIILKNNSALKYYIYIPEDCHKINFNALGLIVKDIQFISVSSNEVSEYYNKMHDEYSQEYKTYYKILLA